MKALASSPAEADLLSTVATIRVSPVKTALCLGAGRMGLPPPFAVRGARDRSALGLGAAGSCTPLQIAASRPAPPRSYPQAGRHRPAATRKPVRHYLAATRKAVRTAL